MNDIDKIRCSECSRSFIHAMWCSKYGTAAPLSPNALHTVMMVNPDAYVEEQWAHTGELSALPLRPYQSGRLDPFAPTLAELAARNGDDRFVKRDMSDAGVLAYFAQPLLSIPIEPEKIAAVVARAKKITSPLPNPFDDPPLDTFPA
jgi:hypothetical protein